MQAISEHLFRRGKRGTFYMRRRIPTHLRDAYPPNKSEVLVSLRTSDAAVAKRLLRAESSRLDEEFERKHVKLQQRWRASSSRRVNHLSEPHLKDLAQDWVRCVLETDEDIRNRGMDEEEFQAHGARICEQRAELGGLLARGQAQQILPAMRIFFHLKGIDAQLSAQEEKAASYTFLQAVVTALDHLARRQAGEVVPTDEAGKSATNPKSWQDAFEAWRDYVQDRPKTTAIACNTAWRQLKAFASKHDVLWPAHVTPELMDDLVEDMKTLGLAPATINGRIGKIREVFKLACGKHLLKTNPATDTLGVRIAKSMQGRKKRQSFSLEDIKTIFSSPIFTGHLRSRGQSGEASYWIPLMMHYTGARPEEIAGLLLQDIRHAPGLGWYFHITDLPTSDDEALFDDEPRVETEASRSRRPLKNAVSRRNVPVAQELIDLGLLRYVQYIEKTGEERLFPTLRPDAHGKLSGAHSKFFGRYKRTLGITAKTKSLYSLRHRMKDNMEAAKVPSKYLKRILGHATGDGKITDNYGSDLPLEIVVEHFSKIKFPPIPALPWQPGKGTVILKERATSKPHKKVHDPNR